MAGIKGSGSSCDCRESGWECDNEPSIRGEGGERGEKMFQLPTTLMGRQPKAVNDCMCAWHCLSWEELTKQKEGRKENSSKETESKRGVVWISSTIQMSSLAGIVHACSK